MALKGDGIAKAPGRVPTKNPGKGLGKGLGALFTEAEYFVENNEGAINTARISDIEPDKNQPRRVFNEQALVSLAESIERHGILQPLVVRKVKTSSDLKTARVYISILGSKSKKNTMEGLKNASAMRDKINSVQTKEEFEKILLEYFKQIQNNIG